SRNRGERAAVVGDGAHAFALEKAGALDERGQERPVSAPYHLVGRRPVHSVIAHGEIEGTGIAHVARNARETRVEHENADREAEDIGAAADAHRWPQFSSEGFWRTRRRCPRISASSGASGKSGRYGSQA